MNYTIAIHKPYDFKTVLAFLKRHEAYGIEKVTDNSYIRYIPNANSYATVKVTKDSDILLVCISGCEPNDEILHKVKHLFDTQHNPNILPKISGVRVVGCFEPFEVAVSIILGQLISVKQATKKLQQLIEAFGRHITDGVYSFPSPKQLIDADIEKIGITKTKAGAIRTLSQMLETKEFEFSNELGFDEISKQLLSIKGIGPWTTQMILMRCFHYKDAFAKNDLFIKKAIDLGVVDELSWQGNRAYLTHYIWNKEFL